MPQKCWPTGIKTHNNSRKQSVICYVLIIRFLTVLLTKMLLFSHFPNGYPTEFLEICKTHPVPYFRSFIFPGLSVFPLLQMNVVMCIHVQQTCIDIKCVLPLSL